MYNMADKPLPAGKIISANAEGNEWVKETSCKNDEFWNVIGLKLSADSSCKNLGGQFMDSGEAPPPHYFIGQNVGRSRACRNGDVGSGNADVSIRVLSGFYHLIVDTV